MSAKVEFPSHVFGPGKVAVRLATPYKVGACKTDVRFYRETGGRRKPYTIGQALGKNRLWLRVKINQKRWHAGRLIAWMN